MDILLPPKPWYVRYRYYLLALVLFLAFTVYVVILAFGPRRMRIHAEDYRTSPVVHDYFHEYVDVEGIVSPIQTIQVNAHEGGYVERIVSEEGTMLRAGDTILTLSNPDLLRTIEEERDAWENALVNFRQQEIEIDRRSLTLRQQALDAHHQMSSLDKTLKQSREEYRMGIKSKAEMEVIEEDYDYQRQKVNLQMQSLHHDSTTNILQREMIRATRESAHNKFARSNARIEGLVVRATVAGQLSFLNATIGQQISSGTGICSIKVLSQFKIHVGLSEYYIDRIVTGLPASIGYQGRRYPLRISKVVPEVHDRTFPCDLVFTRSMPSNIRLGKSYRVQIELGKPERTIVIPRGDFCSYTSGRWIYRLSADGKTARKVEIELGRQNPRQYEVISGLKPGDMVITSGYDKLADAPEELIIK